MMTLHRNSIENNNNGRHNILILVGRMAPLRNPLLLYNTSPFKLTLKCASFKAEFTNFTHKRAFSNKAGGNLGVYGHEKPENPWDDASYRSLKYEPTLTGSPIMTVFNMTRPGTQPFLDESLDIMPRNFFGVPATIPPEIGSRIEHTYRLPPQFYPFLKKLGDDTPSLKPYMDKLIKGELTFSDYEEMFYKFSKPLKIYRKLIAMPFRTALERSCEDAVSWESAWYTYRQQVAAEYNVVISLREYILGMLIGIYFAYLWKEMNWQYRADMRLFYSHAPEHKINWVQPRGDLV